MYARNAFREKRKKSFSSPSGSSESRVPPQNENAVRTRLGFAIVANSAGDVCYFGANVVERPAIVSLYLTETTRHFVITELGTPVNGGCRSYFDKRRK